MFHNTTRRRGYVAARLALGAAVLTGAAFASSDLWAVSKTAQGKSASAAVAGAGSAWKTHAYSKTSEFSERLTLLEFSDKNDPACESTTKLLNEMRRKNYPIQRVFRTLVRESAGKVEVFFGRPLPVGYLRSNVW